MMRVRDKPLAFDFNYEVEEAGVDLIGYADSSGVFDKTMKLVCDDSMETAMDSVDTQTVLEAEVLEAERLFREELAICQDEVDKCNQFFYTFMAIHGEYGEKKEVKELVDPRPLFWRTVLGSLQEAMFIALGRVFNDGSTHSLYSLKTQAKACPQMFTREALSRRKLALNLTDYDKWLPQFIEEAHVPAEADFDYLRGQLATHRKIYNDKLLRIRDKWFAHREIGDKRLANELFAKTEVAELESMMTFITRYQHAFFDLFENGRRPLIEERVLTTNDLRAQVNVMDSLYTIQGRAVMETQQFFAGVVPKTT